MNTSDGGLAALSDALEELTTLELLSAEALRRGYFDYPEVEDAHKIALARAVLRKKIGKETTKETLDSEKLKKYYELQKKRFKHGVQRHVIHLLVQTSSKGMSDDAANKVAARAALLVQDISDKEQFRKRLKPLLDEYGTQVRIEDLPPFDSDDKSFVEPFVKATFQIPKIGGISPPIKTNFGWHVIYVDGEEPAIDRSFEQVKDELAEEVLSSEKKIRAKAFMEKLEKEKGVFYYGDSIDDALSKQ
jgi:hypothetical protein